MERQLLKRIASQIANPRANMLVVDDAIESHVDPKDVPDRQKDRSSSASPQSGK